jgi:hypothetical protein
MSDAAHQIDGFTEARLTSIAVTISEYGPIFHYQYRRFGHLRQRTGPKRQRNLVHEHVLVQNLFHRV